MIKTAQPLSPRTQAFSAVPSGDDENRMFEDGFNQMAYSALVAKFPDLIENIVTFKVLDTDVGTGSGVGAFVMQHNNDTVYIPVVLADNQLKPLDMFYHKNLNVFLPLSNEWLDEVSQLTLDEMGETVTPPKTLRRDVDIRNLVIPPTTGRYAYASAPPTTMEEDLLQMLRHSQEKTAEVKPVLLDFLRKAPDQVKVAFNNTLRQNQKLATQVVQMYGLDALCSALKVASATNRKGGALYLVDRDSPEGEFKDIFGDRSAEAFQRVLREGYAYKEGRQGLDKAVQVQTRLELHTPSKSGFYHVFDKDGTVHHAFVLHNPRHLDGHYEPEGRHGKRHDTLSHGQHEKGYVVVMNGGKWTRCCELIGELLDGGPMAKKSDCFNKLLMGDKGDTPTAGSRGMFVQKTGQGFVGTEPFRVKTVSTDSKGVRRITTDGFPDLTLVTDKTAARMGMHQPKGTNLMYIPVDARFVKLDDRESYDTDLLRTPTEVSRWFYDKFEGMGARSVMLKNAGIGHASINGEPGMPPVQAMKEAALRYNIHFSAAENLVKQAMEVEGKGVKAFILTPAMNEKVAQTPMMDPSSQMQGAPPPGGAPPMDPAMQGAAPAAPPPPPSPLDIAMGEAQTQIQQQMMDLEQQAMALQGQVQTLQMVGQRAMEIAGGGAPVVGQGAPPMPPGGAPPPQDPMAAGAGGMPQGGGAAPPPGGDPMAGGMGGAPAPGGMGGMTGQEQMAPMGPGAMMATETPSASEIQNQVNPQFLEQAGQLQDADTFDAAAIGSMAQAPSFRDMVTDYVPTMERALDNMGRVLLTMWMQEGELKEQIGEDEYVDLEDNLRAVFDGLGDLILTMNRNATVLSQQQQGM
jgi:hypothetical protein